MWLLKEFMLFMMAIGSLGAVDAQEYNQKDALGQKQGKWYETWPNSTIKRYSGQFQDDKPVGTFYFWYEDGKDRAIMKYRNHGRVAYVQFYHEAGQKIMATGKYINKQKDSVWVHYDQKGRLSYKENYVNGKLQGERTVYYVATDVSANSSSFREGKIFKVETYKDSILHGPYKEFFPDGKKKVVGTYVDGNLDGTYTVYHPNGRPETIAKYQFAVKHGPTVYFNEAGQIIGKSVYDKGRRLKGKELESWLEHNGG